jgi:hypothetical protein
MAALAAALASIAAPAWADPDRGEGEGAPVAAGADPAELRAAAEAFDAGSAAFKRKDFEEAAAHFEAAYAAVPSAKALRLAIRSHAEGGHGARAATLAAIAQARYARDDATAKLAAETLEQLEPLLQRVQVTCAPACLLIAGGSETLPGEPSTRWIVYVDPGKATLLGSFGEGRPTASKEVAAVAGRTTSVTLEAKSKAAPPAPPAPPAPAPPQPVVAPPPASPEPPPPPPEPSSGHGAPRGVFYGGLAVTAVLAGVTVWSGVDTLSNPGADAVRTACAGKGEACPEYEAGRAHQARTNVLLGATIGTAAATGLIGLFFTSWKGREAASSASTAPRVLPSASVLPSGGALGAVGRF